MVSLVNGVSVGCPSLANAFGDSSGKGKQEVHLPSAGTSKLGGVASTGESRTRI